MAQGGQHGPVVSDGGLAMHRTNTATVTCCMCLFRDVLDAMPSVLVRTIELLQVSQG